MNGPEAAIRRRVLLVEDETLIAMDLEEWLTDLGCQVIGPFRRNGDALRAIAEISVDFAVLDYVLGAEISVPVADELARRRVPYLFLTGSNDLAWEETQRDAPRLNKPISRHQMTEAIERLWARHRPASPRPEHATCGTSRPA